MTRSEVAPVASPAASSASFTTAADESGRTGDTGRIEDVDTGSVRLVTVSGDLDLEVADQLYRHLAPTLAQDEAVVDLRAVTFLSSSAVSALLRAHLHRTRAGAPEMTVIADDRASLRPLALSGVDAVLHISDTVPAARETRP
ncbi:STAS domain-containing protein [Rhodococcoides kroppenstedtii]|uniref:STAS domain-containing protein n=1 Tax=Rhodococcoides kroppenstedtii TaxID=293050 RepID=UPI00363C2F10